MGVLSVLHPKAGDVTVGWDKNNPDEIENAQATFDDLTKKGHLAYKQTKDGTKGERMLKFDPNVEKIIIAPALKGG